MHIILDIFLSYIQTCKNGVGCGFCNGLLGLCGDAESQDDPPADCCFNFLLVRGVLSTDLKYFSCIESSDASFLGDMKLPLRFSPVWGDHFSASCAVAALLRFLSCGVHTGGLHIAALSSCFLLCCALLMLLSEDLPESVCLHSWVEPSSLSRPRLLSPLFL